MNTKQTNTKALAEPDIPQVNEYTKAHQALFAVVMTAGLCSTYGAIYSAYLADFSKGPSLLAGAHILLAGILALAVAIVPIRLAEPLGEADFDQRMQLWLGALAMMTLDGFFQMNAIRLYVESMGGVMPTMLHEVNFEQRLNPVWFGMVAALAIIQLAPLLLISGLKGATKSQREALQRYQVKMAEVAAHAEAKAAEIEMTQVRQAEEARLHQIGLIERRVKSRARKAGETLTSKQFRTRVKAEMEMCGLIEITPPDEPDGLPQQPRDNVVVLNTIRGRIEKAMMEPRPNFSW